MVKFLIILVLSPLFFSMAFSQGKDTIGIIDPNTFSIPNECNEEDFKKAIYEGIKYPLEAIDNQKSGKVFAEFQIDYDGKVDSIRIVRGIGGICDRIVLERIKRVADSMMYKFCWSRRSVKKDFRLQKRIISISFPSDSVDSTINKGSDYWNILGRITKKEWGNKNPHKIQIELPKVFEYGERLVFKVRFLNLSKNTWELLNPKTSSNVKFYYFAENDAYRYPKHPIEPKSVSRIGVPLSEAENLKRYEETLYDAPQGVVEWLAPPKDKSVQISIDSSYVFSAFLPKPYNFEIGEKYYCWIEYTDEENRVVSNTIGFKIELTNQSIEKLINVNENKSDNFMKANSINPKSIFYRLRGPMIHADENIDLAQWDIVYQRASLNFRDWWFTNKGSSYLKKTIAEINKHNKR